MGHDFDEIDIDYARDRASERAEHWRRLLVTYMAHVIDCEGDSFIDLGMKPIDADDAVELREIEAEARKLLS